jgi:hypothetical protein
MCARANAAGEPSVDTRARAKRRCEATFGARARRRERARVGATARRSASVARVGIFLARHGVGARCVERRQSAGAATRISTIGVARNIRDARRGDWCDLV